jgi:hypothetical protein
VFHSARPPAIPERDAPGHSKGGTPARASLGSRTPTTRRDVLGAPDARRRGSRRRREVRAGRRCSETELPSRARRDVERAARSRGAAWVDPVPRAREPVPGRRGKRGTAPPMPSRMPSCRSRGQLALRASGAGGRRRRPKRRRSAGRGARTRRGKPGSASPGEATPGSRPCQESARQEGGFPTCNPLSDFSLRTRNGHGL